MNDRGAWHYKLQLLMYLYYPELSCANSRGMRSQQCARLPFQRLKFTLLAIEKTLPPGMHKSRTPGRHGKKISYGGA